MCTFASMFKEKDFILDEIFGDRLLISVRADQTELNDNIRVAQ
jgi:hypothetical protein